MKIGIIDADLLDNGTRHPNLALMKLSGYYKKNGCEVKLLSNYDELDNYDRVFISKVFTFTDVPNVIYEKENVIIGGTGFFEDGGEFLADEIEHHMPDYTLYDEYISKKILEGKKVSNYTDYRNYSIGFTTRGCFRKCSFCVNKKYSSAFRHSKVSEFYDSNRKYIYLWDDNILAFSGWREVIDELEETGKPFQFRQGLDIRLMTDEKARKLSKVKYHGDFIFAFDHIEDRDLIEKKLRLWKRYCTKTTKLYVLCAYETQDELDIINTFERIKILMKYGCLPYIMRYEDYNKSDYRDMYIQLARWCNQPQFFKKKSFRQFCVANQEYHKNKETHCASYRAMLEFEEKHPDIAMKYFDLRYEEENEYGDVFGYGRRYNHKQDCDKCNIEGKMWLDAYNGLTPKKDILKNYYTKEMDLECLNYKNTLCDGVDSKKIANWFLDLLKTTSIDEIIQAIREADLELVLPSNIPQFSSIEDSLLNTVDILSKLGGERVTFEDLGYYLGGKSKKKLAQKKYGENHSKFLTLLDLATIVSKNNVMLIGESILGSAYINLDENEKRQIAAKLMLRIPIIQAILLNAEKKEVNVIDFMDGLSAKTRVRRKPNVVELVRFINKYTVSDIEYIINNIKEI